MFFPYVCFGWRLKNGDSDSFRGYFDRHQATTGRAQPFSLLSLKSRSQVFLLDQVLEILCVLLLRQLSVLVLVQCLVRLGCEKGERGRREWVSPEARSTGERLTHKADLVLDLLVREHVVLVEVLCLLHGKVPIAVHVVHLEHRKNVKVSHCE